MIDSKNLARELQSEFSKMEQSPTYSQILDAVDRSNGLKNHNVAAAQARHLFCQETSFYLHIDNGGYTFEWSKSTSTLKINVSFYGYSTHVHLFKITDKQRKALLGMRFRWLEQEMQDPRELKQRPSLQWISANTNINWVGMQNLDFSSEWQNISISTVYMMDAIQWRKFERMLET